MSWCGDVVWVGFLLLVAGANLTALTPETPENYFCGLYALSPLLAIMAIFMFWEFLIFNLSDIAPFPRNSAGWQLLHFACEVWRSAWEKSKLPQLLKVLCLQGANAKQSKSSLFSVTSVNGKYAQSIYFQLLLWEFPIFTLFTSQMQLDKRK